MILLLFPPTLNSHEIMSVDPEIHMGSGSGSEVKLPFSFEIEPSTAKSYPIAITILHKLDNISIDKLPQDFHTERSIFRLRLDIASVILSLLSTYLYVKIQNQVTDKDWQVGIIYQILNQYFGLIKLPRDTKSRDINLRFTDKVSIFATPDDYKLNWKVKLNELYNNVEETEAIILNFSMKVPRSAARSQNYDNLQYGILNSPQSQNDPLKFLFSRYFNILYSLHTPLSYFPKTALSRFKNLCDNDVGKMNSILQRLYLPIVELDIRHDGKYGILKLIDTPSLTQNSLDSKEKCELENQQEFIKKHDSLIAAVKTKERYDSKSMSNKKDETSPITDVSIEEKIVTLVLELKIREAQLQILILLELLELREISEAKFLEENQLKQEKELSKLKKQSKRSLVRKKNGKESKKIIPTFLGMGIGMNDAKTDSKLIIKAPQTTQIDNFSLYNSMNTLVDRMGIWDTLLGKSSGDKNDSSFGFLAYVLIPYYNRKLPITIKYIIDKFKSLNPKLVKHSSKRSKSQSEKSGKNSSSSSLIEGEVLIDLDSTVGKELNDSVANQIDAQKTLEASKKISGPIKVPSLKKSVTSISRSNSIAESGLRNHKNNDDLAPAFSLKRSKSNLSSKNLQRRQVDMSINSKSMSESYDKKGMLDPKSASVGISGVDKTERNNSEVNKLFIFGDARKFKSLTINKTHKIAEAELQSDAKSQVQATPAKRGKITRSIPNNRVIMATPMKPSRDQGIVVETPKTSISDKSAIIPDSTMKTKMRLSDKLLNETLRPPTYRDEFSIISSPVMDESHNHATYSPIKDLHESSQVIESSPSKASPSIFSTDQRKRRKPGDPTSIIESPLFNTALNGSPIKARGRSVNSAINDIDEQHQPVFKKASIVRKKSNNNLQNENMNLSINQDQETDDDEINEDGSDYDSDLERLTSSNRKATKTYGRSKSMIT